MKRASNVCIVVLLLAISFFVGNLNYTQEIVRLRELDRTIHSFDFYLKDTTMPSDELLVFFEQLSEKYEVSIVKTDINDVITKAGVFNEKTFPYQQFGLTQLAFEQYPTGVYTNVESEQKIDHIPSFLQARTIYLMTLAHYFTNASHSINGQYKVTSTYDFDEEDVLNELSQFFAIEASALTEPTFASEVGYINRDLLMIVMIAVIGFVLLMLTTMYQPMASMKDIGVKKLLGFSNIAILWQFMKSNIVILLGGSVLINSIPFIVFEYVPNNFTMMMVLAHFILLQLYLLLLNAVVYGVISHINISSMLKGFSSFKLGLYINYALKAMMTVFMTVLLIGVGNSLLEEQKELAYQEQWSTQGDYLTLETVRSSDQLWQASLSDFKNFNEYYYQVYRTLSENMLTFYVRGSQINLTAVTTPKEQYQYQLTDDVSVLYANQAHLQQHGFDVVVADGKKTILFPIEMKQNEERTIFLAKLITFLSLDYEEQQQTTIDQMSVEIAYYEEDKEMFPYNDALTENFHNPIISVIDDQQMLEEERAYLANTGLSNPIKIANTTLNQQKIEAIVSNLPDGSYLKFSSLTSIQQGRVDTYREAARNFYVLFAVLALLSLVVSYFVIKSVFIWRRAQISTMKFLGWKLFDRYQFLLTAVAVMYIVPLPFIVIFGNSMIPLLVFISFTLFDVVVMLMLASQIEQKNIVQFLKGESL